ncbi:3-hydroxyacyl-ACP dehydratase FabZ family protein [Rhodoferax sp.]|uniref:3-hydroxyacyl-ACP dehydratase FabZ family protein n=1 Tax=Rhodoferax sp. TaxID=50421 RepID=UPI0027431FEB|nr:3-hydroxyacyl-ACP dehydratase [Rhodoferax sp.]
MTKEVLHYPFALGRTEIEALLPHRGDIFVCQHLTVEGKHHFKGTARWPLANAVIQGHFPGLPVVPGVLLIEAMAQLAGAGLLAGDPYVRSLTGDLLGVLASVRKCLFKHPVQPERDVEFVMHCRQMAPTAVQVAASVTTGEIEVAQLDIVVVYTSRQQMMSAFDGA